MKPEEEAEIILWDWLKTKSKYLKEIYFNRVNKIDAPIFRIVGESKDKPDFVISIDRGYGIENYAIEIKDNSKRRNVLDGHKIFRYHNLYRESKSEYYLEDVKIEIKGFLIATVSSKDGHIFKKEDEGHLVDNINDASDPNWKKCLAQWGQEPKFEYFGSSQFQRTLFAQFREERKKFDNGKAPAIGILTSNILNKNGECSNLPFMFIMSYNDYNPQMKSKWGCRFREI